MRLCEEREAIRAFCRGVSQALRRGCAFGRCRLAPAAAAPVCDEWSLSLSMALPSYLLYLCACVHVRE